MTPHRWFPSRRHDSVAELQTLVDELTALLDGGRELAAKDIPAFKARLRHLSDDCQAIGDRLARPLGFSLEDAAAAVLKLANMHMAGAIRLVSLSPGYDPRDFVLFAFGGAGPLHAVAIARELGIPEVLVPARPGLTNALGCLVADLRQDLVNTVNAPLATLDMSVVKATLEALGIPRKTFYDKLSRYGITRAAYDNG